MKKSCSKAIHCKASSNRAVVNELEFNYIKSYLDKVSSISNTRDWERNCLLI